MSIKNRYELVFVYDVRDANPNGDPDSSNMPRIDDGTGENIVTDVRLKRTIRDYWLANGKEVLVRAVTDDEGNRKSMEALALDFLGVEKIKKKEASNYRSKLMDGLPEKYIDVRSFGAAVTLTGANVSITGPVQFGLGRSMNIPNIQSRTITTSLASGEEKGQGTFGSYHTVDYSIIKFHGLISEISAKETEFTEEDATELINALWCGTKQLNTRSKFNHMPRILIVVESKESTAQIGDLDLTMNLIDKEDVDSIEAGVIETKRFVNRVTSMKSNIKEIKYKFDKDVKFAFDSKEISQTDLIKKLSGISCVELDIEGC
ncbi:MAG: type I-B CRISPR-associated protein Cas7/Csh2 [Candidatus Lokiarchaeota archaeon]|nr:type I-B CRISPR-associated protein Cas7/Csh2 [Candidatus Lokiarchaeota archaeon]